MKNDIIVYTDGASRGNPGPGGWAAVIFAGGYVMEVAGRVPRATNNQMELEAVRVVLSDSAALSSKDPIVIHSDSTYVVNGLSSWMYGWEKKGWMTIQKKPVENKAVWQKLLVLAKRYGDRLILKKVSGHAGELYNERCDELAVAAALGKKQELFKGKAGDYGAFLKKIGVTEKKAAPKKSKSSKAAYSYVSLVGGNVHADKTWAACEKRVKGKPGAKYKKVFSKEEETELVQEYTLRSLV
ncbi:MAG TPA: viroplasmin family protein [Candidatus Paceibacterota bacterium]|nr:viroplasmin family protein [Candidatus Paceibacterota bacterium]